MSSPCHSPVTDFILKVPLSHSNAASPTATVTDSFETGPKLSNGKGIPTTAPTVPSAVVLGKRKAEAMEEDNSNSTTTTTITTTAAAAAKPQPGYEVRVKERFRSFGRCFDLLRVRDSARQSFKRTICEIKEANCMVKIAPYVLNNDGIPVSDEPAWEVFDQALEEWLENWAATIWGDEQGKDVWIEHGDEGVDGDDELSPEKSPENRTKTKNQRKATQKGRQLFWSNGDDQAEIRMIVREMFKYMSCLAADDVRARKKHGGKARPPKASTLPPPPTSPAPAPVLSSGPTLLLVSSAPIPSAPASSAPASSTVSSSTSDSSTPAIASIPFLEYLAAGQLDDTREVQNLHEAAKREEDVFGPTQTGDYVADLLLHQHRLKYRRVMRGLEPYDDEMRKLEAMYPYGFGLVDKWPGAWEGATIGKYWGIATTKH